MSLKYISSLAALGIVAMTATSAIGESEVSNNASFACVDDNGVAVTVSQIDGNSKPIFHWQGTLLESLDADATVLCNTAATSLNDYVSANYTDESVNSSSLFNFKAEQILGNPIICAANSLTNDCEAVLFTLSPTEKPVLTANNLLTDILDKTWQGDKIESQSSERGVQSISYSISILDLIFGPKYLK